MDLQKLAQLAKNNPAAAKAFLSKKDTSKTPREIKKEDKVFTESQLTTIVSALVQKEVSKIPTPKDGETPSKEEITKLIKPLMPVIRQPKDGKDAEVTPDFVDKVANRVLKQVAVTPDLTQAIVKVFSEEKVKADDIPGFTELKERVEKLAKNQKYLGQGKGIASGYTDSDVLRVLAANGYSPDGGLPDQTGNSGKYLMTDGTEASWVALDGGGDMAAATYDPAGKEEQVLTISDPVVEGPASATNNAIARYDGTTGKLLQDSGVYIGDTGNLGIGITSPGQELSVFGDIELTKEDGSFPSTTSYAYSDTSFHGPRYAMFRAGGTEASPTAVTTNQYIGWLDFFGHDGTSYNRTGQFLFTSDAGVATGINPGRVNIQTSDTSGNLQSRFLARADGATFMAIGPDHKLKLGGSGNAPNNKLDVEGACVIGSSYAAVQTAPTDGLLVEGSVGIGTSNPVAPLQVAKSTADLYDGTDVGQAAVVETGATIFIDNVNNTVDSFGQIVFRNGSSGQIYNRIASVRDASGSGSFRFVTGNSSSASEKMVIAAAGNVGIGETAPLNKLDVAGGVVIGNNDAGVVTAPANGLSVEGSILAGGVANIDGELILGNTTDGSNISLAGKSGVSNTMTYTSDNGGLLTWSINAGADRYVQYTNIGAGTLGLLADNMGIGTTSPSAKLDIEDSGTGDLLELRRTAVGYYTIDFAGGTANIETDVNHILQSSNGISLVTNNVTDATAKLVRFGSPHYTNSEQPFITIFSNSNSVSNALNLGGGTSSGNAATEINFHTAANTTTTTGTERMTISSTGNVGIGSTTPDTTLDVNGAITQRPLSADPSDPDAGNSVTWVSDGTGSGDAGDVMMKINVGGTTKTLTLVDYSALS